MHLPGFEIAFGILTYICVDKFMECGDESVQGSDESPKSCYVDHVIHMKMNATRLSSTMK